MSNADEILKLKTLLDQGLLTRQEFELEKAKLLEAPLPDDLEDPPPQPAPPQKGPGFGITGMVLGILGLLSGFATQAPEVAEEPDGIMRSVGRAALFPILGIVFGGVGCSRDRRGRGMAIAGVVCGGVGLLLGLARIGGR